MSTSNLIPSRICNNPWSRLSLASFLFPTGTLCSRLGLSTGACTFGTTVTLGDRLLIGSFALSAGTLTGILIGHCFFSSVYEILWRAKLCASLIINIFFNMRIYQYADTYHEDMTSCIICLFDNQWICQYADMSIRGHIYWKHLWTTKLDRKDAVFHQVNWG